MQLNRDLIRVILALILALSSLFLSYKHFESAQTVSGISEVSSLVFAFYGIAAILFLNFLQGLAAIYIGRKNSNLTKKAFLVFSVVSFLLGIITYGRFPFYNLAIWSSLALMGGSIIIFFYTLTRKK